MIDVARVDICAVIEKVARDLFGTGKVQRRLPVAPARLHEIWIGGEKFTQPVEKTESSSGVNIDLRTAFDSVTGDFERSTMKDTEPSRPPFALRINVRAEFQQQIEHSPAFCVHNRR